MRDPEWSQIVTVLEDRMGWCDLFNPDDGRPALMFRALCDWLEGTGERAAVERAQDQVQAAHLLTFSVRRNRAGCYEAYWITLLLWWLGQGGTAPVVFALDVVQRLPICPSLERM